MINRIITILKWIDSHPPSKHAFNLALGILICATMTLWALSEANDHFSKHSDDETYGYMVAVTMAIITFGPLFLGYIAGRNHESR